MSSHPFYMVLCCQGRASLQLLPTVSLYLVVLFALPQVHGAAISSPSPTTSTPSSSSSASATASALDPKATDPTHDGSGGLSAAGKAGICVGVALGVIAMAIVLGDIWFLHSKRGTKTDGDAEVSGHGLESQRAAVAQKVSPKLSTRHQYIL